MPSAPTLASPETIAALRQQDALQLRATLLDMVDLGAQLARITVHVAGVEADAVKPSAAAVAECAGSYDRVTRSMRRSALLIQKLTEPAPHAVRPAPDRVAIRKEIIRDVEDALYRSALGEEGERLRAEFLERLEGAEFEEEIGQRPVADIIADILSDLGIYGPDSLDRWMRRTPADVAILCARAAAPCRADPAPLVTPQPLQHRVPRKAHSGFDDEDEAPWRGVIRIRDP